MEGLLHGMFRPTPSLGVRGMALRPSSTCRFSTPLCAASGYCHRLEKFNGNGEAWDRNQASLDAVTAQEFSDWCAKTTAAARKPGYRCDWLRWGKVGEPLSTAKAVEKVASLVEATPTTVHSIPTKGWRDSEVWAAIRDRLLPLRNAKLVLSFDSSIMGRKPHGEASCFLLADYFGLRTMFFGDDKSHPWDFPGTPFVVKKCLKTWQGATRVDDPCRVCRLCYEDRDDGGRPFAIWLKKHS